MTFSPIIIHIAQATTTTKVYTLAVKHENPSNRGHKNGIKKIQMSSQ